MVEEREVQGLRRRREFDSSSLRRGDLDREEHFFL